MRKITTYLITFILVCFSEYAKANQNIVILIQNSNIQSPLYNQVWFLFLVCVLFLATAWLILAKVASFNLTDYQENDDFLLLKKKARLLSVAVFFIIPGINFIESEILHQYIVNWYLCFGIIPFCVTIFIYSYYKQSNYNTLYYLMIIGYSYLCVFEMVKMHSNNLQETLIIQNTILFLASILIFKNIKSTFVFAIAVFIGLFFVVVYSTPHSSNIALLISASIQAFTAVFIIQFIERKKLSRMLFSDKILHHSEAFVIVFDVNGKTIFTNPYLQKTFGYEANRFLGDGYWNLKSLSQDEQAIVKLDIKNTILANDPKNYVIRVNIENGKSFDISCQDSVIEGRYLLSIGKDITNQLKQQKELQQLSLVAEKTTNSTIITDTQEKIIWVNKAFTDLTEYTFDEAIGQEPSVLLQGKLTKDEDRLRIREAVITKKPTKVELVNYKKSGIPYWTRLYIDPIFDDKGNFTHFISVDYDITEAKEKEKKNIRYNAMLLKFSLKPFISFESLSHAINEIISELASALEVERVSVWEFNQQRLKCSYLFDSVNNIIEKDILLHQSDYPNYFNAIDKGVTLIANNVYECIDTAEFIESYFKVLDIKSMLDVPLRYNGKLVGLVCCESIMEFKTWTIEDETFIRSVADLIMGYTEAQKLKEVEEAIAQSENNFRQLNETIDDVFWLLDLKTIKIEYISPSCEKILGIGQQEFYSTNNYWTKYIFDEDKSKILEAHKLINEIGYYEVEYRINYKGETKWIFEKSFGIKDKHGNFAKSSGICSDITQKKLHELELEKSRAQLKVYSDNLELQNSLKENLIKAKSIDDITRHTLNLLKSKFSDCITVSLLTLDDKKNNLVGFYINEDVVVSEKYDLVDVKSYQHSKLGELYIERDLVSVTTKSASDIEQVGLGVKSYIVVPIMASGELVAVLNFMFSDLFNLSTTEIKNLEEFANVLSPTIQQIALQKLLQDKNRGIMSSLRYAQSIQQSVMPNSILQEAPVKDLMIHYKPRDIVSGDFYWIEHVNNYTIIAVGDCTGHGVPGAFLTLLGISIIQKIVLENKVTSPGVLLKIVDREMFNLLNLNSHELVRDGMELSICFIDNNTKVLTHAGAGLGLVMYRGDEQIIIKGTRSPIGDYKESIISFDENIIECRGGEKFYLFSDGYQDQLGGHNYKRLSKKVFFDILTYIKDLPVKEQELILEKKLKEHMRHFSQTDDITVLGFTIK